MIDYIFTCVKFFMQVARLQHSGQIAKNKEHDVLGYGYLIRQAFMRYPTSRHAVEAKLASDLYVLVLLTILHLVNVLFFI